MPKNINLSIPRFPGNLPWFMFDLYNYQLITSVTIPEGEITDNKEVIITETPIPGKNFAPISVGGNGNRVISFSIPILAKNNTIGNVLLLKQFDLLRNQGRGFLGLSALGQFSPNPKVLYMWGVGSVPLVYYVTKCQMKHRSDMVNQFGQPQYTMIDIELKLDETHPLYMLEERFRDVSALAGETISAFNVGINQVTGRAVF